MSKQTPESFWARVDIRGDDECWPWTGSCNNTGYGSVSWHGGAYTAHRVAAWLDGLVSEPAAPKNRRGTGFILHSCDNRLCCNTRHFRVGTYAENQLEAYQRRRRAQPKGSLHANAKLTDTEAQAIRAAHTAGCRQVDLAAQYGVSQRVVSLITRGESYTNV